MKKQILMLSAAVMLTVASCSKSNEEPTDETVSCQLTQASVSGGGETITNSYQFDANGKITNVNSTSVINNGSPSVNPYSYSYTTDSFTDGDATYSLDASGRIKSRTTYYKLNNITYASTFSYTYSTDGYITEMKNSNTNESIKYTWSNGNLTKIEEVYGAGVPANIEFYDYSTDAKPDNFHSDVPDLPIIYSYVFKFMGKQSKNLVSKLRYEDGSTSEIYSYGRDNNGNVISLTEKEEGTGKTWSTYDFKYTCK